MIDYFLRDTRPGLESYFGGPESCSTECRIGNLASAGIEDAVGDSTMGSQGGDRIAQRDVSSTGADGEAKQLRGSAYRWDEQECGQQAR